MTMLFIGMSVGVIIGLLLGSFATAWYSVNKEIDRLRREQREARISAAGRKTDC